MSTPNSPEYPQFSGANPQQSPYSPPTTPYGSTQPSSPYPGSPYPAPPSQPMYGAPPSQPMYGASPFPAPPSMPGAGWRPAATPASAATTNPIGLVVATIGGAVTLLSFFILPYVSLGAFGNYTGSQLAGFLNQLSTFASSLSQSSDTANSMGDASFLLWSQALTGGIAAGLAGWQWMRARQSVGALIARGAVIGALVCGGISALIALILYAQLGQYTSFLGFGFYIMLLGAAAVIGGTIKQLRA